MPKKPSTDDSTRPIFSKGDELFDDSLQKELEEQKSKPVECLGKTFPNDAARREYYLARLKEHLEDPEFRETPGFPRGTDEDILKLSDPPYYTACPNPFLDDFIKVHGKPYSPKAKYHREPLAVDVSVGKNDPIYNAHTYHTKVPHRAIMQYLFHYTNPGDIVLDGFCGTGMTAVAARECGLVSESEVPEGCSRGARIPVVSDLSVLPAFIASVLTSATDTAMLRRVFSAILETVDARLGHHYLTSEGYRINYVVWSDVFVCAECSKHIVFWEMESKGQTTCPHCKASVKKRTLERAFETRLDPVLNRSIRVARRVPVRLNYTDAKGKRHSRDTDAHDVAMAATAAQSLPAGPFPTTAIPQQERYFRDGLHLVGLTHFHQLYFPRQLHLLSAIWGAIATAEIPSGLRPALRFVVTAMLDRNLTIRNRFVINEHNPRGRINGPLANTLYVPGLSVEQNPIEALGYKVDDVVAGLRGSEFPHIVSTSDLSTLALPDKSVDYIFVDPPFGHNIMYSELNGVTESWLGVTSNASPEAVVTKAGGKSVVDYMRLMAGCFASCYRVLKPGRWMTIEFHNSQNSIWMAIQQAIADAGFVIADVRTLDKQKGTINQEFYSSGAVKQDLVISAYRPNGGLEERFRLEAGTEAGVWDFVRTHLQHLPACTMSKGKLEPVLERQGYLLFDRMVAFHVQRGVTVPMSAAEFYEGLGQRFAERDGMFFLAEHVAEYDRKRAAGAEFGQLELFVTDELSAIRWLARELREKPQRIQELRPAFMQEIVGWAKHEQPLELATLLGQNFLCYDSQDEVPSQIHAYLSSNFKELRGKPKDDPELRAKAKDRWYVPDPKKSGDLEKLRERELLKEFEGYKASKAKQLKVFRVEAMRAGFKAAYDKKDYATIVDLAEKLPETVLQEDEKLLMYYDVASMRLGDREGKSELF